MDTGGPQRLLLDVEEAAHLLGIGRSKCYELLKARELISVNVGRRRLVPRQSLEDFIERRLAASA